MNVLESLSTRPYLIRALYEWCSDNGLTPYVAVLADDTVQVPREYVRGGEIVLNISADATSGLKIGNEYLEFKARFGGVPRDIAVPVDRVMAIYARETGQGMAFPMQATLADGGLAPLPAAVDGAPAAPTIQLVPPAADEAGEPEPPPPPPPPGRRPALKRVK
ncbi:MAG TPA: ClpXP protease specificity-enhancing factor [Ottowia sp.]|uniref:ClpXP protease specificity-enhancing factor n=1 Tax=Ottowia sp. TaxID=1898956 RepID=UPI002BCBA60C|nr:ClpXP protease specificity-enhancing factor [Ottowia sp.]HMN19879.1 ClpXP protease specificity-enhancing factor [Ottowia sp.]